MVKPRVHSVFSKLLMVMAAAALGVNLLLVIFIGRVLSEFTREPFHKNAIQYVNYLIDDLGSPPDYKRAITIAREASLVIQYRGPDASWSTSPMGGAFNNARLIPSQESPEIRFGKWRGHHFIQVDRGDQCFIFEMAKPERQLNLLKKMAMLFVILMSLVLLTTYLVIRRILNPINALADGVREVGAGNLEYAVDVKRKDELGELAAAFNDMTRQIREMLHSKERLMLDVSHELRSPLTRMKVSLEMLPDSDIRDIIKEDVAEMENMVTEILETARLRSPGGGLNLTATDLRALIAEVVAAFQDTPPGVRLEPITKTSVVEADPGKIRIVFNNIISNALKYSTDSTTPVRITLSEHADYVSVQVSDKGIGIDKKDIPFVFEPFYRTDTSRSKRTGGYGLGLSLCKTIMAAHGGKIGIDSSPETGTRVTLLFPKTDSVHGRD